MLTIQLACYTPRSRVWQTSLIDCSTLSPEPGLGPRFGPLPALQAASAVTGCCPKRNPVFHSVTGVIISIITNHEFEFHKQK